LTGTDGYTLATTGNTQNGGISQNLTGTDSYSRVETGTDSSVPLSTSSTGSNSFGQLQVTNDVAAQIALTQTGTNRYNLLEQFNDPSDGSNGGYGVAAFSPVGAPVLVTAGTPAPTGTMQSAGDIQHLYCFVKGTLVLLADGSRQAIDTLQAGQMVMAVPENDPLAGPMPAKVLQVYHNDPASICHLQLADEIVRTTPNHPFFVENKGWVKAQDLLPGDLLRTARGDFLPVQSLALTTAVEPVFNIQVETCHTYFVALSQNGHAILVHNWSLPTMSDLKSLTWSDVADLIGTTWNTTKYAVPHFWSSTGVGLTEAQDMLTGNTEELTNVASNEDYMIAHNQSINGEHGSELTYGAKALSQGGLNFLNVITDVLAASANFELQHSPFTLGPLINGLNLLGVNVQMPTISLGGDWSRCVGIDESDATHFSSKLSGGIALFAAAAVAALPAAARLGIPLLMQQGAVAGGGFAILGQGAKMADTGNWRDLDWQSVGQNTAVAALLAPVCGAVPKVAGTFFFGMMGYNGYQEAQQGHILSAGLDFLGAGLAGWGALSTNSTPIERSLLNRLNPLNYSIEAPQGGVTLGMNGGGEFNFKYNAPGAAESTAVAPEFVFRTMSAKEFASLQENGGLVIRARGSSELGITLNPDYGSNWMASRPAEYTVKVQFEVTPGTFDKLISQGATHPSTRQMFPNLPAFEAGMKVPQVKIERGGVLSILLGNSPNGVEYFNQNIIAIRRR